MYKQTTLLFLFLIAFGFANAQKDTTVWKVERHIEENRYILNIPNDWRKINLSPESEYEHKYEISGVGITPMFNNAPLVGFMTIKAVKEADINAEIAKEKEILWLQKDRIPQITGDFDSSEIKIQSGEAATFIHSNYYRRLKVQNYSNYFLFIKEPKENKVLVLNIHFNYKDASYKILFEQKLKEYALKVFEKFQLR